MQSVSSGIWTRVTVSISSDDNHYTTGTSLIYRLFIHATLEEDIAACSIPYLLLEFTPNVFCLR